MAYEAYWDTSGIDYNGVGIRIVGQEAYAIYWGDGTQEFVSNNRDDDGDGVLDTATYSHNYTMDGVYDVTIVDNPNRPRTDDVRMRAYMHNNDPDGTLVAGSNLKDMVLTGIGNDSISTGIGNDWVDANAGDDTIDGGKGDDFLIGGEGSDIIRGGQGNDLIAGGFDDATPGAVDRFEGGEGEDTFYSGKGVAIITGGAGADTFGFGSVGDSNAVDGIDRIRDFEQGVDHIFLLLNGASASGSLTFIGGDRFSGEAGEYRYQYKGGETRVSVDLDGDRNADLQIDLVGRYDLSEGDFFVV